MSTNNRNNPQQVNNIEETNSLDFIINPIELKDMESFNKSNDEEREEIDFKVFKATVCSLIEGKKDEELKDYLYKWYQNQETLFKTLKEQIVNLLEENTFFEKQYKKQINLRCQDLKDVLDKREYFNQEIKKVKEEIQLLQTGGTQAEVKRKFDKLNQKINDLRYDLNPKAERIELTKKVNKTEKQITAQWKEIELLRNKVDTFDKRLTALIIDNELKEIFPASETAISNEIKKRRLSNFQIEIDLTNEQDKKSQEQAN
ncbi:hypothetical protein BCR36DRAFT_369738 [Piromyces finnis]|uniref:Uncharacterized protein n=1 Tax=Piromyces finnis TaxID=1754191 RepID=A0A1Y1VB93_9FUNG|nr:hypothetical protein BCR36DRAFT_369738 [Piromyces finnis]|eukprot:ORX51830.1 hypothetical protein BCR36DRAFT_369738 [Piromyces finnis]